MLWGKNQSPSDKFRTKLEDLAKKIETGDLASLPPPPRRGRQGNTPREPGGRENAAAPKRRGRPPKTDGETRSAAGKTAAGAGAKPELLDLIRSMLVYALASDDPRPRIEAAIQFLDGERA